MTNVLTIERQREIYDKGKDTDTWRRMYVKTESDYSDVTTTQGKLRPADSHQKLEQAKNGLSLGAC